MPSPRSDWVRTTQGWRRGSYEIERLAPRMWVLTCLGRDPAASPTIVTTSSSLRALKYVAERREKNITRRRILWTHGLVVITALAGLLAASLLTPHVMLITTVLLLGLLLRSVSIFVVVATNAAWTRVRHTYQ